MHASKISHWRAWSYMPCWMPRWTRLSLSLQRVSSFVRYMYILFGDRLLCFHGETIFHMTWSPEFSCEAWNRGDGFHWRLCLCPSSTPSRLWEFWELWWLHERKDPLFDGYHSCLRPPISGDMSNKTHAAILGKNFRLLKPKSHISASSQRSFHNTWKRQWFPRMGHLYRRRYSRREWWNFRWVECHCTVPPQVLLSPPRPILLSLVQELAPTTLLRCLLWSGGPWCGFRVFIMTLSTLLVWAPARSRPALMFSWRLHVNGPMLCAQHRLQLAMQHVYGHTGNLGTECADHAAALGSHGLISSHNVSTRWFRHNFDTSACCDQWDSEQRRYFKMGVSAVFTIGFFVSLSHTLMCHRWFCSQPFFPAQPLCSWGKTMESPTSSVSTGSSVGENFAHNMWNPLLELLFHEQICGVFVLYVEEIDLANIALSCHFALDLICYKEGVYDSVWCFIGHNCLRKRVFCFWHDTIVMAIGSKLGLCQRGVLLQPSQTVFLLDPTSLVIDTKRAYVLRTSMALPLFGSRLYMVLIEVTVWSVTNPLTLFEIRFS